MTQRRIAITGMSAISCFGIGAEQFWDGMIAGPPADERPPWRPVDLDLCWASLPNRKLKSRLDVTAAVALVAACDALNDAGADVPHLDRCGAVLGSTVVALDTLREDFRLLDSGRADEISVFSQPKVMVNASVANFVIHAGFRGPSMYVSAACASGNAAAFTASMLIQSGICDLVVAGGFEVSGRDLNSATLTQMGVPTDTGISHPFDKRHDGVVIGEGAGVLVFESWDHAVSRGARIRGELLGSFSNSDAYHITSPNPTGDTQADCMSRAIASAGLSPGDIRMVSTHGNSTPYNDDSEAAALHKTFAGHNPAIFSFKGATGHTWGASGAMGIVALLLAMEKQVIPPTWGFESPSEAAEGLDITHGTPRPWEPGPAMSNAFGFGGHNACVVVGPAPLS